MPIFMQMGSPKEGQYLLGEVKKPPHVGWFEVSSFRFLHTGVINGIVRTRGVGVDPPLPADAIVTMTSDRAALLFKEAMSSHAASADGFETVVLDFQRDNNQPYLVIKLIDVVIAQITTTSGERPTSAVTLAFEDVDSDITAATALLNSRLPFAVLRHLVQAFTGAGP